MNRVRLSADHASAWVSDDGTKRPSSWTVLVVDDEPDIRYLLKVTLELAGYRVVEAAHGGAALELARRSAPQLVITDQMMPVMNGGELIERLRVLPVGPRRELGLRN